MDILIRDVDSSTVTYFEKKAKDNGVSRNTLIKRYLNMYQANEESKKEKESMDYTLNKLANAFEFTQERLGSLEENFENVLMLIAISAGIDFNDIPDIINNYKRKGD